MSVRSLILGTLDACIITASSMYVAERIRPKSAETGNIAASGMLGGEGITGVGIAIVKMITGG